MNASLVKVYFIEKNRFLIPKSLLFSNKFTLDVKKGASKAVTPMVFCNFVGEKEIKI